MARVKARAAAAAANLSKQNAFKQSRRLTCFELSGDRLKGNIKQYSASPIRKRGNHAFYYSGWGVGEYLQA